MNVLVLGSGGREHAIGWKLAQSSHITSLFIGPGNAGTSNIGTNVDLNPEDFKAELGKSRALRKENENDELGYRPDYIPAPRREYRKSTSSKPTLESKDGKIRLNKFISNAGICSRREADDLIQSGAVKVNGEIVTTLGFRVSPIDKIQYGDQTLTREKKQYLLLNKPKDYITTSNDPEGRKTVMDLVKDLPEPEALNLRRMLDDWLAGIVDRKFEAAVEAGAFDAMAAEALREAEAGKTIPLDEILDDRRVP
jgi:ribosomal 50S subunit-recycling heat shock protein